MASVELQCYNKGCTKKFNPNCNSDDACQYHPGGPIFHDALKGWSCCKKRTSDFTEFLNIPGCTRGQHCNEKPKLPEPKEEQECTNIEKLIAEQSTPNIIKPEALETRPSEHESKLKLKATVGSTLKQALDKLMKEMSLESSNAAVASTGNEIQKGTCCKNNACKQSYEDEASNTETCFHHPGSPIFHEGMKYWSCCQKKTSEFDNFLAQEGCTSGRHVWIKEENAETNVLCRYDWHQTGNFVTISVFAKVAIPEKCVIEANKVAVKMSIVFDGGKSHFTQDILLKGVVNPEKSNVKLLGTKVEVNLRKMEPGSWSTLELPIRPKESDSDSTENY